MRKNKQTKKTRDILPELLCYKLRGDVLVASWKRDQDGFAAVSGTGAWFDELGKTRHKWKIEAVRFRDLAALLKRYSFAALHYGKTRKEACANSLRWWRIWRRIVKSKKQKPQH